MSITMCYYHFHHFYYFSCLIIQYVKSMTLTPQKMMITETKIILVVCSTPFQYFNFSYCYYY